MVRPSPRLWFRKGVLSMGCRKQNRQGGLDDDVIGGGERRGGQAHGRRVWKVWRRSAARAGGWAAAGCIMKYRGSVFVV